MTTEKDRKNRKYNTERIETFVTPELDNVLRQYAKIHNTKISKVVNEAIFNYLKVKLEVN